MARYVHADYIWHWDTEALAQLSDKAGVRNERVKNIPQNPIRGSHKNELSCLGKHFAVIVKSMHNMQNAYKYYNNMRQMCGVRYIKWYTNVW